MQDDLNIKEKYELLIATLNMVLVPVLEIGVSYLDTVQYCLDELEGDYYTFLHEDLVSELRKAGMIADADFITIKNIRSKIDQIENDEWNVQGFLNDKNWQEIRDLIVNLYSGHQKEF